MHILYDLKKSKVTDISLGVKEFEILGAKLRDKIRGFEGKVEKLVYFLLKEKVFLNSAICMINNVCLWACPMIYGRVAIDSSIRSIQHDFGDNYRAAMILLKGYSEINLLKENAASGVNIPPKFVSFEVPVTEEEFYEFGILFNVARNNFNELLIKKDARWKLRLANQFFYTGNDGQGRMHVYTQEMVDTLDGEDIKKFNPFAVSDTRNPELREKNQGVIADIRKKIDGKKSFFSKLKKKKMPEFKVDKSFFEEELVDDPLFERLKMAGLLDSFLKMEKLFDVIKKSEKKDTDKTKKSVKKKKKKS